MLCRKVVISDPAGLHLRPAQKFCETAMRYESRITIELRDGSTHANAKSVLSVLAAGVRCGDEIRICCDGADEEEALEALGSIFETNE